MNEYVLNLTDLGDAMAETKQESPWPPYYIDFIFALGNRPD